MSNSAPIYDPEKFGHVRLDIVGGRWTGMQGYPTVARQRKRGGWWYRVLVRDTLRSRWIPERFLAWPDWWLALSEGERRRIIEGEH